MAISHEHRPDRALVLELQGKLAEEKRVRQCTRNEIARVVVEMGLRALNDDPTIAPEDIERIQTAAARCQRAEEIRSMIDRMNRSDTEIKELMERIRTA